MRMPWLRTGELIRTSWSSARSQVILQRFKRDYRKARKHAEFDAEKLEYVFDALISGGTLPSALREHRLGIPLVVLRTLKRSVTHT